MRSTWMLQITYNNFKYFNFLQASSFFFKILIKFIEFSLFFKNAYFYSFFFKLNFVYTFFNKKFKVNTKLLNFNNKIFQDFEDLKFEKLNEKETNKKKVSFSLINSRNNLKNWSYFHPKINFFFLNFLFTFTSYNSFFNYHHSYHFFYLKEFKKNLIILNMPKFIARWVDGQNFIFNVYYYNFLPLVFGSSEFKNEILSLNWHYNHIDINFWKYSFSFFIFKPNRYDTKIKFFFNKLLFFKINFFFVTNANYHYKNLHYFTKMHFFTLGPVNSNLAPWILSYSLPVLSVSPLIEYFFLKLILILEKNALSVKYHLFKLTWNTFVQMNRMTNMIF